MKILHTSDWHLGHILYEHERTAEHLSFIGQLSDIIKRERPDAMLVCGDVYDRANPSVMVQKLFYQSMLEFHSVCPGMSIVVVAGNHDGKSMIELGYDLWSMAGVTVIGQVDRHNLDKHIVEIKDSVGRKTGYIVAVPHIYEQNYPMIVDGEYSGNRKRIFYQFLLDKVRLLNTENLPVVLTGHLTITDCDISGQDLCTIGGLDQTPQEDLGTGYDYLALGHIHKPQNLGSGAGMARYCGSPVPVSFDENYQHSVSVVTVERGSIIEMKAVEIENIKPLLTVPSIPVSFKDAVCELSKLDSDLVCYVRLNVLLDGPMPSDYTERVNNILKGKKADFCYCNVTRNIMNDACKGKFVTYDEFQEMGPLDVVREYYRIRHGTDISEEKIEMIKSAIKKANMKNS